MSADRGFLFVLNVEEGRTGSEKDVKKLLETFEIMGAEVHSKINPGGKDIRKIMKELKDKDFTNYSYVAIAHMSHGSEDGYVETKDEIIKAQKSILIPLCNNPSLNGKLKVLIMQTCRGQYDFIKDATEGVDPTIKYPRYCAKLFATSDGMKAYRLGSEGSLFINALCNRLRFEYMTNDILSIMDKVRDDVVARCYNLTEFNYVQVPSSEDNFGSKKFYFNRNS